MNRYLHLVKPGTLFDDRHVTRASEMLQAWNGKEKVEGYAVVGVPLSKSSISHSGASFAPGTIRRAFSSYTTYSIEKDYDLIGTKLHDFGDIRIHVTDIAASQERVYDMVSAILTDHKVFPIILGGDNSITFPNVKAFAETKGKVGIIQFDAHHDVRNLVDGGPSNGTPFRSLLENKIIDGENLVQIGIRNFSNSKAYRDYVSEHSAHVFTMKDVREQGIVSILQEVIADLAKRVDAIYVSLDMDVVDQAFAPGCPAIGPGGMNTDTLFDAFDFLGRQPLVQGFEVVEIDPTVDFRDMTSRLAAYTILTLLAGKNYV